MSYDALLLDHDGVVVTLGDHTALHDAAHAALEDAGIDNPAPDAVDALSIAVDESELLGVSRRYDVDPDRLWAYRDDRVAEALREETRTGRKAPYDDVDELATLDVPIGIVSNNQTRIVEFVLDYYDLAAYFDTVHARDPTRESLRRKKPNPTYLEAAIADLDVSNPLYVGDSESDVTAGQRAGLDTAFLYRPHRDGYDLGVDPEYEVGGFSDIVTLLNGGMVDSPSTYCTDSRTE
jgi:HAD superfamily hydrolase (TIGR01549 family)